VRDRDRGTLVLIESINSEMIGNRSAKFFPRLMAAMKNVLQT